MIQTNTTEVGVFKQLAEAIQPHLPGTIDADRVEAICDEKIAAARLPRPIEVRMAEQTITLKERAHRQFEEVLSFVQAGFVNVMMVGPAGTGKTTLAKAVSDALGRKFGILALSMGITETHIFGRMLPQSDGSWAYVESNFVRIYRNGGIFLFDEIDAADGNVLVSINAAMANGHLCNPVNGELVERHPDCIIITAGNTFGRGADSVYVGRNQMDGATLDRFVLATVFVSYDTDLEADMVRAALSASDADDLLEWVTELRAKIVSNRLRRIASTRLVIGAIKHLRAGKTLADVQRMYFVDWSRDELTKVGR